MNCARSINQQNQIAIQSEWHENVLPAFDSQGNPNYLDDQGELISGIYTDLPNELYRLLDAHSSTGIKLFSKGAHHYYRKYLSNIDRTRTLTQKRTFDAGTYGHMLCLEEHNFHGNYIKAPQPSDFPGLDLIISIEQLKHALAKLSLPVSGAKTELIERLIKADPSAPVFEVLKNQKIRQFLETKYTNIIETNEEIIKIATKANLDISLSRKALIEQLMDINPDLPIWEELVNKHVIDHIVWDDAFRVRTSTRAHPKADWLLSNGLPELTVIAQCPNTGLMLKVRFDWLRFDSIAVDVKTCQTTNPTKFSYQAKDLRYDLQAAFYMYVGNLAGIPVKHFAFVATEYKDADNTETFEVSERRAFETTNELHQLIEDFQYRLENNLWYGHSLSRDTWVID